MPNSVSAILISLFNWTKKYKLVFILIGVFAVIVILGYLLAAMSWDTIMDTLLATEVP